MCSTFNCLLRLVKRQDSRAAVHLYPSSLVSSTVCVFLSYILIYSFHFCQPQQATYFISVLVDPAYLWDLFIYQQFIMTLLTTDLIFHQGQYIPRAKGGGLQLLSTPIYFIMFTIFTHGFTNISRGHYMPRGTRGEGA